MKRISNKIIIAVASVVLSAQTIYAQEATQIFNGATSQLKTLVAPICSLLQVILAIVCLLYSVLNAKKAMGGDHDAQNAIAKVLGYGAAGFILLYVFKGIANGAGA